MTPNTLTTFAPRLDYQLTTNNTLTVRVEERLNFAREPGSAAIDLPPPYSRPGV